MTKNQDKGSKLVTWGIYLAIMGILATIAGVGITLYLRQLDKKIKALEYIYASEISLWDIRAGKALDIKYKGQRVDHLSQVKVIIRNSGNLPIVEKKDVLQHLTLSFNKGARIIGRTVYAYPQNIKVEANIDDTGRNMVLRFDALDVNDRIEAFIYFTGYLITPPKLQTRILGLKNKKPDFIDRSKELVTTRPALPLPRSQSFFFSWLGALIAYILLFRQKRLKLVLAFPKRHRRLLFFDLIAFFVLPQIVTTYLLQPTTARAALIMGAAWVGILIALLRRTELRIVRTLYKKPT